MGGPAKFWIKVALVGGLGGIVLLAIVHRVHFLRKAIGA